MSETDLILGKNRQLRRLNVVIILQQIFLFIAVAGFVFLGVVSRIHPPQAQPTINIIRQDKFPNGNEIAVPDTITAGQVYTYEIKGEKFVDNIADVRQQIVCTINGVENYVTTNTFTSTLPKGTYDMKRTSVIPVSARLQSSDNCKLQSIASYTFYEVDANGNETSLPYTTTGTSNTFKLIVPPVAQTTNSGSTTQNSPTSTGVVNPQNAILNTPKTDTGTSTAQQQTTTSGSGDDPTTNTGPVASLLMTTLSTVNNIL